MSENGAAHRPLTDVLEAYRMEHRDLVETWRALDTKAQGAAANAGIFLAGLFAFLRDVATHPPSAAVRFGLALATVALVVSVIVAILALRIRYTQGAPLGAPLEELARDQMKLAEHERTERSPEAHAAWLRRRSNMILKFYGRPAMFEEDRAAAARTVQALRTVTATVVQLAPPPPDMGAAIRESRKPLSVRAKETFNRQMREARTRPITGER